MKLSAHVLVRHLPGLVLAAVAALNVLLGTGDVHLASGTVDTLNVVLGLVGLGGHINNHR